MKAYRTKIFVRMLLSANKDYPLKGSTPAKIAIYFVLGRKFTAEIGYVSQKTVYSFFSGNILRQGVIKHKIMSFRSEARNLDSNKISMLRFLTYVRNDIFSNFSLSLEMTNELIFLLWHSLRRKEPYIVRAQILK